MINFIDKLKLPFRKDKELFSSLYSILGFYPHNIDIYKQALSHKSVAMKSQNGHRINNERLEFLGDAVIEAVTSDIVYRHFDGKREGFLTTTRSKLVQRDTLNKMAEEVGLDKLIRSSSHQSGHNSYISGNAFEAIVGAIYLDRGYSHCMWFLRRRIIAAHLNLDNVAKKEVNFKSKLLEWAQRNRLRIEIKSDDAPNNAATSETPAFSATVIIEGVECGKGNGFSKKESHQNAARETLKMLNKNKQTVAEILKAKEARTAMEAELVSVPPRVGDEEAQKRPQQHQRRRNSAPRRAVNDKVQVANPDSPKARAMQQSIKAIAMGDDATQRNVEPNAKNSGASSTAAEGNANRRRRNAPRRNAARNQQRGEQKETVSTSCNRNDIIAAAESKAFGE